MHCIITPLNRIIKPAVRSIDYELYHYSSYIHCELAWLAISVQTTCIQQSHGHHETAYTKLLWGRTMIPKQCQCELITGAQGKMRPGWLSLRFNLLYCYSVWSDLVIARPGRAIMRGYGRALIEWFLVGNPRDKLMVRPWPHDKVIARVLSKYDLADCGYLLA